MKRAVLFSFADRGAETAGRIAAALTGGFETLLLSPRGDLKEAVAENFNTADALVFVGACGIAVRAIAPYVVSKTTDPAVISVDELGRYVIPLLSGHIGGANELAHLIADRLDSTAVITTATDINSRFSVDAWAHGQGLVISDMNTAKRFSAEILKRDLPLYSDVRIYGDVPKGLYRGMLGDLGAAVTYRTAEPFETTLALIPRILHVGIGCRRGTSSKDICAAVSRVFTENGLRLEAIACVASIDVKSDEAGLLAACTELGADIRFFTAEELNSLEGSFTLSEFVRSVVGVDNVCERAAVCSAGKGASLIVKKNGLDGVTVAVAAENRRYSFE